MSVPVGTRVCLPKSEDAPFQMATVIGEYDNGVQMVCIDEEYRQPDDRDGLAEVMVEDLEAWSVPVK